MLPFSNRFGVVFLEFVERIVVHQLASIVIGIDSMAENQVSIFEVAKA